MAKIPFYNDINIIVNYRPSSENKIKVLAYYVFIKY